MMLSQDAYAFRCQLLDALGQLAPPDRFWPIDQDRALTACPVCSGPLSIRFLGDLAAADVDCLGHGCSEGQITAALVAVIREAA